MKRTRNLWKASGRKLSGLVLTSIFLLTGTCGIFSTLSAQAYKPGLEEQNHVTAFSGQTLSFPERPQTKTPPPESKDMYAYMLYHADKPGYMGLVSFNSSELEEIEFITPANQSLPVCAACYVDEDMDGQGVYYAVAMEEIVGMGVRASRFMRVDLETGISTTIAEYPASSTLSFTDMDYDYQAQTLYAVSNNNETSDIYTLNLSDGEFTHIATIPSPLFTLAIDLEGQMFSIGLDGNLYRVDLESWRAEKVGSTGFYPYGSQSMSFDLGDNSLYWTYFNNGMGKLLQMTLKPGLPPKSATWEETANW